MYECVKRNKKSKNGKGEIDIPKNFDGKDVEVKRSLA